MGTRYGGIHSRIKLQAPFSAVTCAAVQLGITKNEKTEKICQNAREAFRGGKEPARKRPADSETRRTILGAEEKTYPEASGGRDPAEDRRTHETRPRPRLHYVFGDSRRVPPH